MAFPIEKTGASVWVVRVEYLNGNKMYFAFESEDEARQFRSQVTTGEMGGRIKRAQEFSVPMCRLAPQ